MKKNIKNTGKGIFKGLGGAITLGVSAAAGWIVFSRKYIRHDMPLGEALDADREEFQSEHAGHLSYYADRSAEGRPIVLLHSINAAPSAYEMKPIFEHFRGKRPIYALDLPGFGFSERSDRLYSPLLYQNAISSFLRDVVREPADVVALSLSCEFSALSAAHEPSHFHSLAMISPTGFNPQNAVKFSQQVKQSSTKNSLYAGLAVPLWNRPFYDLITSRPTIHYFLNKSFEGLVPDHLVDYAYQTAHQPGAQFAPTYFLSGKLFTPAVRETVYGILDIPVLVIYDRDPYTNFEMLPVLLRANKHWKAVRIAPTKGLPHWECPAKTFAALETFWTEV